MAERDGLGARNAEARATTPFERSLGGIFLAQLAFGVLGAMAITGEYATGTIRATFAAVPRRLPVLWAKLGVFVAVTLVLGTIACVLAFVGGQAIFATKDVDASFSDPHVARAVFGSGLFLTGMGAFGARARRAAAQHRRRDHDADPAAVRACRLIVDLLPERRTRSARTCRRRGRAVVALDRGSGASSGRGPGFGVLCAYVVVDDRERPPSCWTRRDA